MNWRLACWVASKAKCSRVLVVFVFVILNHMAMTIVRTMTRSKAPIRAMFMFMSVKNDGMVGIDSFLGIVSYLY